MDQNYEFWGLTLALLANVIASVWWAATITSKVNHIETQVGSQITDQRSSDRDMNEIKQALARIEERTNNTGLSVERFDHRLGAMEKRLNATTGKG